MRAMTGLGVSVSAAHIFATDALAQNFKTEILAEITIPQVLKVSQQDQAIITKGFTNTLLEVIGASNPNVAVSAKVVILEE